jgi:hypothetical protein
MAENVSPSILNYRIPAATIKIKKAGDVAYIDAGNLVDFVYTPTITKKEHFSARTGIRAKDKTNVTQSGASIKYTVDEWTSRNIAMFLLADVSTDTDGNIIIDPLTEPNLTVDILVEGTNTEGPQIDFEGNVTISPSGDLELMADNDDYAKIPMSADVNKANGRFGRFTVRPQA